ALAWPLHRRPCAVAPVGGVARRASGHLDLLHPELVAIVEERCPAQRQEHQERAPDLALVAAAPAGREAHEVVVRPRPDGPGLRWKRGLGLLDDRAQLRGVE